MKYPRTSCLIVFIGLLLALYLCTLADWNSCLPDTPDRMFAGRSSTGACLYFDMNNDMQVVEELPNE